MPHRDVTFVRKTALSVFEPGGPQAVGIDAGHVSDIVAVLLEPVEGCVVGTEKIILGACGRTSAICSNYGPVVAHCVGAVLRAKARAWNVWVIDSSACI